MVYNLDMERMNCQKLFNLLCLYGNIDKINFIRSKDGCAMVEFASATAASATFWKATSRWPTCSSTGARPTKTSSPRAAKACARG